MKIVIKIPVKLQNFNESVEKNHGDFNGEKYE